MPSLVNIPSTCVSCLNKGYGARSGGIKTSILGFITIEDNQFRHVTCYAQWMSMRINYNQQNPAMEKKIVESILPLIPKMSELVKLSQTCIATRLSSSSIEKRLQQRPLLPKE